MKKLLCFLFVFIVSGCSLLSYLPIEKEKQPEEPMIPSVVDDTYHYNYYYSLLDNDGKSIYNEIYDSVANFSQSFPLTGENYETFLKAQVAFNYDHPEYYWTYEFECTTSFGKVTNVTYTNEPNQEEYNNCESIADSIISMIDSDSSTYEKIKTIYEYIINNTDYDSNAQYNQDIRSVLEYQTSVCAGYTRTFQFLCDKLCIPCIYVTGTGKDGEAHSWNEVQIDDNWYWVDVTWGDPVYDNESQMGGSMNYTYLCVNDDEFLNTHTIKTGFDLSNYSISDIYTYPECWDNSYNYYVLKGCYFYNYDPNEISYYIGQNLQYGITDNIEMKFSNEESYQEAYYDLFQKNNGEGAIFDIIQTYTSPSRSMKYEVHYSDTMYYISIFIYIS